jgi:hypothetical protein
MSMKTHSVVMLVAFPCVAVGMLVGWFASARVSEARFSQAMLEMSYLSDASTIRYSLALIKEAQTGDEPRLIKTMESRISVALVALKDFGATPPVANRATVLGILEDLGDYQLRTRGHMEPELEVLLAHLKEPAAP